MGLFNSFTTNEPLLQKISDLEQKIVDLKRENYGMRIQHAAILYNHEYKVGEVVYYANICDEWRRFEVESIDEYNYMLRSTTGALMPINILKLNDRNVISRELKDKYPERFEKMEATLND